VTEDHGRNIPRCRHGVQLEAHQDFVKLEFASGAPTRYEPGRIELLPPKCPTPHECWVEAITAIKESQ
jgi:hypothetical protein